MGEVLYNETVVKLEGIEYNGKYIPAYDIVYHEGDLQVGRDVYWLFEDLEPLENGIYESKEGLEFLVKDGIVIKIK